MISRVLRRSGVQPRPWRALVRAFLCADLRCPHYAKATGSRPHEVFPPLFWVVLQYLFSSGVAAALLFVRVDVQAFSLATLALSMLLTFSAVAVEFNEVVFDPGDAMVTGPRPVSLRTYAAARLTNLAFYGALITAATSVFPAVLGAGLRDAGLWFLPAYLGAAALLNAGVILLTILLWSFFRPPQSGKTDWRDVLAWTQVLLAMVIFYGGQVVLRDQSHAVELFLDDPPAWCRWLPAWWGAEWVSAAAWNPRLSLLVPLAAGLAAAGGLAALTCHFLVRNYRMAQPAGRATRQDAGALTVRPGRPFLSPLGLRLAGGVRSVAAAEALCARLLARDNDLRMRSLPSLATALAVLLMGWLLGEAQDPFTGQPHQVLSIATLQLIVMAVPVVLYNMRFGRDAEVSWIMETSSIPGGPRTFSHAMRRCLCRRVFYPLLLVMTVVFALLWQNVWHALLHGAMGVLAVEGFSRWMLRFLGYPLPCSEAVSRGDIAGAVAPYAAAGGAFALFLGALEYFLDPYPAGVAGQFLFLAVFLAAAVLTERKGGRA